MRCSPYFFNFIIFAFALISTLFVSFDMAWFGRFHGKNNHELVQHLIDTKVIKSERVIRAMRSVDRGNYVDSGQPYVDAPQGIGYGVTISAPHMHGYALQLLEDKLQDGRRALDVGSGSGYLTACFAMMVGPRGMAIGIDHISELKETAATNIAKDNPELLESGRLKLVVGDGRLGWPEEAPYHAIHVGAAAKEPPQALLDQLAPGGRMLVPVGAENSNQTLIQFDKLENGEIKRKSLMGVVYVPLTDRERQSPSWK